MAELTSGAAADAQAEMRRVRRVALGAAAMVSLFWVAVFYPALMSPDSLRQWAEAISGRMNDAHPIGMTLIMRGVHVGFGTLPMQNQVAVTAWIQGTVFWFSIFLLVLLANFPLRITAALCGLATLYCPLWLYTVTLWKDVWFSASLVFLLWCLGRAYFGSVPLRKTGWLLSAAIFSILLQRHTAWISFLFLSGATAPVLLPRSRVRALPVFCLIAVLSLATAAAAQKLVHKALAVESMEGTVNWLAVFEIAGTAHYADRPASRWLQLRTARLLGEQRFRDVLEGYHCGASADYMFGEHTLNPRKDAIPNHAAVRDLAGAVQSDPLAYLKHRICSAAFLLGIDTARVYYPFHDRVDVNGFGIEAASRLPRVQSWVIWWEFASSRRFPLSLAFRHYVLLLASALVTAIAMLVRKSRHAGLIYLLFMGGQAVLFPLLLITPAADWRYLMPADVCWIASLLVAGGSWLESRGGRWLRGATVG